MEQKKINGVITNVYSPSRGFVQITFKNEKFEDHKLVIQPTIALVPNNKVSAKLLDESTSLINSTIELTITNYKITKAQNNRALAKLSGTKKILIGEKPIALSEMTSNPIGFYVTTEMLETI